MRNPILHLVATAVLTLAPAAVAAAPGALTKDETKGGVATPKQRNSRGGRRNWSIEFTQPGESSPSRLFCNLDAENTVKLSLAATGSPQGGEAAVHWERVLSRKAEDRRIDVKIFESCKAEATRLARCYAGGGVDCEVTRDEALGNIAALQHSVFVQAHAGSARGAAIEKNAQINDAQQTAIDENAEIDDAQQTTIDANADINNAQQATIEANAETNDAQQTAIDKNVETNDAQQTTIDENAETNDAQQTAIGANAETNARQSISLDAQQTQLDEQRTRLEGHRLLQRQMFALSLIDGGMAEVDPKAVRGWTDRELSVAIGFWTTLRLTGMAAPFEDLRKTVESTAASR